MRMTASVRKSEKTNRWFIKEMSLNGKKVERVDFEAHKVLIPGTSERDKIAKKNGIARNGYNTVRNGYVPSYSGDTWTYYKGHLVHLVGHAPSGNAHFISRDGYIQMECFSLPEEFEKFNGQFEVEYNKESELFGKGTEIRKYEWATEKKSDSL